ncbi:OmpA family protein [Acinetobacter sp. ANC 4178]|uniref:OmpA family protein n=1 Tax=Acinetobacter sp. ANC 4178 TaxID=2529839 RepID=UPI00103C46AD|nr:OmpA family protein [Acinetobacter sp. ANC 4178]TCB67057.1 OmpA family protein [Acinetobacter sp. ANC 4178]
MNVKILVLMVGCSLFWAGCSTTNKNPPFEHWEQFGSKPYLQPKVVKEGHTQVVFIRDKEGLKGPAANVFIDGHYLTSLLPGSFKAMQLCARSTRINAIYTQSTLNYANARRQNSTQSLTDGSTQYFKLVAGTNQALQVQELTEAQAQPLLPDLKEAVATKSRVKEIEECAQPVYVQVPVKTILKKYTLQASTLFNYAKSGPNDLTAQGRKEVAEIASEITQDQEAISHIAVIGYTDPVGSDNSNQQLAQRRAETVRALLVQNGAVKKNILVEGRGEQELVVSDCDQKYANDKAAREQCDLPNRRVEIVTYGMKAE